MNKQTAARLLNIRRMWQGAWLFVPGALALLFSGPLASLARMESWAIASIGVLALVVGMYWSASGAKCPACNLNLMWHGMTHAGNADWFTWVVNVRSCPRCHYSGSDRSAR